MSCISLSATRREWTRTFFHHRFCPPMHGVFPTKTVMQGLPPNCKLPLPTHRHTHACMHTKPTDQWNHLGWKIALSTDSTQVRAVHFRCSINLAPILGQEQSASFSLRCHHCGPTTPLHSLTATLSVLATVCLSLAVFRPHTHTHTHARSHRVRGYLFLL